MMRKVGMGVDFDPVHKGHIHLIKEGKKIGKVYAYINEDYTAHHTPPFLSFEARQEMCSELGVEAIPVKGLHYRLPLSYTVPIRIHLMANDGVTDIIDAAASHLTVDEVMKISKEFADKEMLMGIPSSWPDRNLIRWVAANELYANHHKKRMGYHITHTYKIDNETVSGRYIRKSILETGRITAPVRHLLPDVSIKIIERELKEGNLSLKRDNDTLLHVANTFSKSKLLTLANINVAAAEELVMGRPYNTEEEMYYPLRRAGYQHVLQNLVISCMERKVTKKEVALLIDNYSKKGITPADQKISSIIERAYFVSRASRILDASKADKIFRAGIKDFWQENLKEVSNLSEVDLKEIKSLREKLPYEEPPKDLLAGVSLKHYETRQVNPKTVCALTAHNGELFAELRIPNKVIIGKLKLPATEITFLRYLLDSQLVPVGAKLELQEEKRRIRIFYGLTQ
ncbi:MAG: nucleotidyl transferase family protein [Candidatus Methanofastidiosia archaeon]